MTEADRKLCREYASKIKDVDPASFAWMLDLVFTHDGEAEHAKSLVCRALRHYAKTIR